MHDLGPKRLWRVFPWDPEAEDGVLFSSRYVPPPAGTGRFDLPSGVARATLYLAETPDHAVAEKLQDLRGQRLEDSDLIEHGHRLALVEVTLAGGVTGRIIDLCDPRILAARSIRPDRLASRRHAVTQPIAAMLYNDLDLVGLRWWSSLDGDWHTAVLFLDKLPLDVFDFGSPQHLTVDHLSVVQAAERMGIARRSR